MNSLFRKFGSELHVSLATDDQQLRLELQALGLDPESEAKALRAMIAIALRRALLEQSFGPATVLGCSLPRQGLFERLRPR